MLRLSAFQNDVNALRKSLTAHSKDDLEDLFVEAFSEEPPEESRQRLISIFIETLIQRQVQGGEWEDVSIKAASLPADLKKSDPIHDTNTIAQSQAAPLKPKPAKDKESQRLNNLAAKKARPKGEDGPTEETQQLRQRAAMQAEAIRAKRDGGKPEAISPPDTATKLPTKPGTSLFISRDRESVQFNIMVANRDIRPFRTPDGSRLVFRVPDELVERFQAHTHCKDGRIVPLTEENRQALGVV